MKKTSKFNLYWNTISDEKYSYDDIQKIINTSSSSVDVVNLPHGSEIQTLNSSGGRCNQEVRWYWNNLPPLEYCNSDSIILYFEGLMFESDFYVNGVLAYTHKCGYTPAVFDITKYLQSGENSVVIKVSNIDNNLIPPGKKQSDLDFNYDGGIYREAQVLVLPQIRFSQPLLANKQASGGIFSATLSADAENAKMIVNSDIENMSNVMQSLQIRHTIVDKDNQVAAVFSEQITSDTLSSVEHQAIISISNPLLWSPMEPNMYNLKSELLNDDNLVLDKVEAPLGIRNLDITYDDGFKINGEKIKVSGGNYHQSFGQLGNAVPENLLRRDAQKLKMAGFDHIRTHYPPAEAFIDECDKIGLMLTISNPGWQYFEAGTFETQSYQNMRDIIRWLRNHPSIVVWEANLNESHMSDEFMMTIQDIVHAELPYGAVYTGSHSEYSDILYTNIDPDMINDQWDVKTESKSKPTWVREYGDNPDNWSDQSTVWRTKRGWGEHLMLRQVNRLISTKYEWLTSYTDMYNAKHVAGFGLWPAIEYNRGYHLNPCYGGIFDLQRIPKYSYYFMRSQKSVYSSKVGTSYEPMVYIASSCTELAPDDLTVYTNCDYAKLYYDDQLIDTQYPINCLVKHPPIVFNGDFRLTRDRSEIRVEGYIDDKVVATHQVRAHGVARALRISIDESNIPFKTDGTDIVVVLVEAIDDEGNRVIYGCDEFPIQLKVSGSGEIIGDAIKTFELGVTSFLLRGTKGQDAINLVASLAINQPYDAVKVKDGTTTIIKE
ncbi:glycoside hydrolase family 2 TIM barrel-domain containing protein [Mollicutes bacterium LVI A0039]|nr:glycoside hydrolase family 2 TIM barrel-domain containing protein [Mollicutes bacterium LVI A0039]